MFLSRQAIPVITDEEGDAVVFSGVVNGQIVAIKYEKASTNGFSAGVDFDVETEALKQEVWSEDDVNDSKAVYPLVGSHNTDGEVILVDESDAVYQRISAIDERVKFTVANGGDTKSGTFYLVVEGVIAQ